jgi:oxygen-independent coproporphyrinogen-3 oxidase
MTQPFRHLYLHIPFCRHKCGYCDFNAYAGMERLMPAYVDALLRELEHARATLNFAQLETVYLGGGTPSLLPVDLIERLLRGVRHVFDVAVDAEVTLEANPASTDGEKLGMWQRGGVNRLSLGVQNFDMRALAVLERRSDGMQGVRAFKDARDAGFTNISIDLIYAVPYQSVASWRDSLRRTIELQPEHVSCYCLSFEEGTLLHRRRAQGVVDELGTDQQWELLRVACDELASAGFSRYEISSWARTGFEARHNSAYWACRQYYGAGAGAHSYTSDGSTARRWWNIARPREYVDATPHVRAGEEELEPRRARAERLMLGLRAEAGLEPPDGFENELQRLAEAGLVFWDERRVRPTRRGLDLHNQVALAVL